MKLGQSETVSVLYHHKRCAGYVDSYLNDGGRHQNIDLARGKAGHYLVLFLPAHFAVQAFYFQIRQSLRQLCRVFHGILHFGRAGHGYRTVADSRGNKYVALLVTFDRGTYNVALTAEGDLLFHKSVQPLPVALINYKGVHPLSAVGHLVDP